MDAQSTEILNNITSKTQSELILFFIILTVILILVLLPIYKMVLADRKAKHAAESTRQDKYIERERQIIQVITANTEVMAGLKATLETNGTSTNVALNRIHEQINSQAVHLLELSRSTAQIQATLDRCIGNQQILLERIDHTYPPQGVDTPPG